MFANNIQQRVERTLFERLRSLVVDQGYLPDITNNVRYPEDLNGRKTPTAQGNWDTDIDTIISTKKWALEIFGTSTAGAKGLKRVPRLVIISKRVLDGDIGLPPGFDYAKNEEDLDNVFFEKRLYPDTSTNMHFDIHLITGNQEQNRFLNVLLGTVLGQRKYITFFDNVDERFFLKYHNYYEVSDSNDSIEESVYQYEVKDLYLFEDGVSIPIVPIKEINIIILFEQISLIVDGVPDYDDIIIGPGPIQTVPFTKVLSGYTVIILKAEHKLNIIRNIRLTRPDGEIADVQGNILGTTVTITSNILLDGYVLMIY